MSLDARFESWMSGHRDLIDHRWVEALSLLGGPTVVVLGLVVVGALSFGLTRRWMLFRNVALSVGAAFLITQSLKFGVGRIRPPIGAAELTSASFPSGHSSASASLYLAVAVELHRVRHPRPALWLGAVTIVLIVPLTRLYLGVHWLSDVIVGSAIGTGVVALVAWRTRRSSDAASAPSLTSR